MNVAKLRVGEHAAHDVFSDNSSIDTAGDEDDGKGDAESDAGGHLGAGEDGRALDVAADERVDDGPGESIDENFEQAQGPDRLDVVFRRMHLCHEAVLTDGEGIGEDDVGGGEESRGEGDVWRRPGRPRNGGEASWGIGSFHACGDHADEDGDDDGGKVDVTEDGELVEGGRKGEAIEQDGGDDAPSQGAETRLVDNANPGDGAGQNVGAGQEDEKEDEHDAREFVAEAAPHQADGIGVVLDMRVLQSDLTDDVAGVDGNEANADCHDDAGDHTQAGEGAGHAEGA